MEFNLHILKLRALTFRQRFLKIFIFNFSKPAMGNLRPFKLFTVALLKPLKYHYFIEKSTKSLEKVSILALDMTF
jgi:hypothetical protein